MSLYKLPSAKKRFIIIVAKVLRGILFILMAPAIVAALYIPIFSIVNPILDNIDHAKYRALDHDLESLHAQLKQVSKDGVWSYHKSCDNRNYSGLGDPDIYCTATLELRKFVTSATEVAALHSKYYPVISSAHFLKPVDNLRLESSETFGKKFVVSGEEQKFYNSSAKIKCDYSIILRQTIMNYAIDSDIFGKKIIGDKGIVVLSVECTSYGARWYWYGQG